MAENNNETGEKKRDQKTPVLEWLVAAIGMILVTGLIGFLLYKTATKNDSPPNLSVESGAIVTTESGYLLKFSLVNNGEEQAADVTVEGKLTRGGEEAETSSVTIAYAPSHSKREGGLFFTKNPQEFQLQIRATGYSAP